MLVVKNLPTNAGELRQASLILGLGRSPGGGQWQPTTLFLPGKSHGLRSLVDYSPWDQKESTEHVCPTATFWGRHNGCGQPPLGIEINPLSILCALKGNKLIAI